MGSRDPSAEVNIPWVRIISFHRSPPSLIKAQANGNATPTSEDNVSPQPLTHDITECIILIDTDARIAQHFRTTLRADLPSEAEIWVLLTRHVTDSKRKSEFISLSAQNKATSDVSSSYLKVGCLSAIAKNVAREIHSVTAQGSYTNSTHFLVSTRVL